MHQNSMFVPDCSWGHGRNIVWDVNHVMVATRPGSEHCVGCESCDGGHETTVGTLCGTWWWPRDHGRNIVWDVMVATRPRSEHCVGCNGGHETTVGNILWDVMVVTRPWSEHCVGHDGDETTVGTFCGMWWWPRDHGRNIVWDVMFASTWSHFFLVIYNQRTDGWTTLELPRLQSKCAPTKKFNRFDSWIIHSKLDYGRFDIDFALSQLGLCMALPTK